MKLLVGAFLLAIPVFISSCISCSHHEESGTIISKVETVSGTGYFDVKKDTLSKKYPSIGKVLRTKYFDVTVDKLLATDAIHVVKNNIINLDLEAEAGNRFLILSVVVKNIDAKNRKMFSDGVIWIYSNGKRYKYDLSESIKSDGYGFILEDIKPGKSETTNIVYKISSTVRGVAYFQPEGSNDDERICLGKI